MKNFEELTDLILKHKMYSFCIAGGSVRDTLMGRVPKDYDVFVFDEFIPKLDGLGPDIIIQSHSYEKFLIKNTEVTLSCGKVSLQVMHVPHHYKGNDRCTLEDCVKNLLDSFDWNVSLFAYYGRGIIMQREKIENIKEGEYLKLQNITNPLSSLFRGQRFSQRFGMKMKHLDIVNLCQRVVDNTTRKQYGKH